MTAATKLETPAPLALARDVGLTQSLTFSRLARLPDHGTSQLTAGRRNESRRLP